MCLKGLLPKLFKSDIYFPDPLNTGPQKLWLKQKDVLVIE